MIASLWHGAADVFARFGEVDARLVIAALAFHLANHVLRSVAWRNVLGAAYPAERIRLLTVASASAVGVALNAVVPGRGGDAAKLGLLRLRVPGSTVPALASTLSVIVIFDLVAATVLLLAVGLSGAVPLSADLPSAPGPWVAGAGILAAVAAVLAARRLRAPLRRLRAQLAQGGAILRTPGRYARSVVAVQAAAWCCRIGVVYCLLAAFGVQATLPRAALVMVLCGASTLVPLTPGGAGTQQVVLAFALSQVATASVVVSFSVGMQAGITAVNALLGLAAGMVAFGTLHPLRAIRSGLGAARAPAAG